MYVRSIVKLIFAHEYQSTKSYNISISAQFGISHFKLMEQSFFPLYVVQSFYPSLHDGFEYAGRLMLEIFNAGLFEKGGTICADEFDSFNDVAATVACITIGYSPPGCEHSVVY